MKQCRQDSNVRVGQRASSIKFKFAICDKESNKPQYDKTEPLYFLDISSLAEIIKTHKVEWQDQTIAYSIKISRIFSQANCYLDEFVNRDMLRMDYKKFIRQTVANLINYQSLSVKDSIGYYKLAQNHMRNSEILLCAAKSLEIKKQVEENTIEFHCWQKKMGFIQFYRRLKQQESSIQYIKYFVGLYSKYSQEQLFNNELRSIHLLKESQIKQIEQCQKINELQIILTFLHQNGKMISFLIIKFINMVLLNSQQRQKIRRVPYFLVLIKSIKKILTSKNGGKKFIVSNIFSFEYCYSLLIVKHSKINQFLQAEINLSTKQIRFRQSQRLSQYISTLRKIKLFSGTYIDEPKNQTRSNQFLLSLGLDLLDFLRNTCITGIDFDIKSQNFVVTENRVAYRLVAPITITKTIEQLLQKNPSLAKMLTRKLNKANKSEEQQSFLRSIYDEKNIIILRIEHLKSIKEKLSYISKQLQQATKILCPERCQKYFHLCLLTIKNFNMDFDIFQTPYEDLKNLLGYQKLIEKLDMNYQNINKKSKDQFLKLKIVEKYIIEKIDNAKKLWFQIFSVNSYLKPRISENQLKNSQKLCHSKILFELLFQEKQQNKIVPKSLQKQRRLPFQKQGKNEKINTHKRYAGNSLSKTIPSQIQQEKANRNYYQQMRNEILQNFLAIKNIEVASYNPQQCDRYIFFISFQHYLKDMAQKITNINKEKFTGIHGVSQIREDYTDIQIHLQCLKQQKTIDFSEINPTKAKDLFYKLLIPRQINKSYNYQQHLFDINKTGKDQLGNQTFSLQRKKFSQFDLENVLKTLFQRIHNVFKVITRLKIKCSLFLLRHFMIDNHINRQNYPNLVPRLNIIQSFIDTNISNKIKQPNFVEEYYINEALNKLDLSEQDHNNLIQAIFLLSLTTQSCQLTYLKQISACLRQKNHQRNLENIINNILSCVGQSQKDHCYYYLENVIESVKIIKICQQKIREHIMNINRSNLPISHDIEQHFFNAQQIKSMSLQDEQIKTSLIVPFTYGKIILCQKLKGQVTFFIKKIYQINRNNQQQRHNRSNAHQMKMKMFKCMYSNMQHLYQCYQANKYLFRQLQPIIFLRSSAEQNQEPSTHFMFISKISNIIHVFRNPFSYFRHFSKNQILNDMIRQKCLYYQLQSSQNKSSLIRQLQDIPINAQELKLQLLNINIGTVDFAEFDEDEEDEQNIYKQFEKPIIKSTYLKPIISDFSLSCYIGREEPLKTYNLEMIRQLFQYLNYGEQLINQNNNPDNNDQILKLQNSFHAFFFTEDADQFLANLYNHELFYSKGQIGFIVCLLQFCDHRFINISYSAKEHPFLTAYRARKNILIRQLHNIELETLRFFSQLKNIVLSLNLGISQEFITFLLNSIHPEKKYRQRNKRIVRS